MSVWERDLRPLLLLCLLSTAMSAQASVYTYAINWTGSNGYTLEGSFSYESSTAGSTVEANELLSFNLEGFHNGASIGTFDELLPTDPIGMETQFNFYTYSESFKIGNVSTEEEYPSIVPAQMWNAYSLPTGIGFTGGSGGQTLWLDGSAILDSKIELNGDPSGSTLTASLTSVPVPAAVWLFGFALAGLGWMRRR